MTVFIQPLALSLLLAGIGSLRCLRCHAFSGPISFTMRDRLVKMEARSLHLEMAAGGTTVTIAEEEEEGEEMEGVAVNGGRMWKDATSSASTSATKRVGINSRGAKMNEVRLINDRGTGGSSRPKPLSKIVVASSSISPPFLRSTSHWSRRTRAYRGAIK
jgi:hypothetical protein